MIKTEGIPKTIRLDSHSKSNPKTKLSIATDSSILTTTKKKVKSKELIMMVSSWRNK
mgnify:CR=1 FL=1